MFALVPDDHVGPFEHTVESNYLETPIEVCLMDVATAGITSSWTPNRHVLRAFHKHTVAGPCSLRGIEKGSL